MFVNTNFRSPNFTKRALPIKYVVFHYTEMDFEDALARLLSPEAEVSAHYLIKENGEILQLVDENNIAWHAGQSCWHGQEKINQNSIGIELDNCGKKAFSKAQIDSCLKICAFLKRKYNIKMQDFIGHSDVAPARKIDPGIFFEWKLFAKYGFGIWHDLKQVHTQSLFTYGDKDQKIEVFQKKLGSLGYNIKASGIFDMQTNYVIRSFQAKFFPEKFLKQEGLDFYSNHESLYEWCTHSDAMLNRLIEYSEK